MFRSLVAALTLIVLAGCADEPARRPGTGAPPPPVSAAPPMPATGAAAPRPATPPAATRPQAAPQDSVRIDGQGMESCTRQCERSNNSCMDSVAARPPVGSDSTLEQERARPFTRTDNCGFQMRQCIARCRP